jgi:hypothetical protein
LAEAEIRYPNVEIEPSQALVARAHRAGLWLKAMAGSIGQVWQLSSAGLIQTSLHPLCG